MKIIRNPKNIILIILALTSAVLCIIMPEKLIMREGTESVGIAMDVPEEYYPTSSYYEVLKESSGRLTDYQKLQLITGKWESELSEVDKDYYEATGYHMESEAKNSIFNLFKIGAYPAYIDSSYNQWFNWKCTYMQALDLNFRSYAGFFWKTVFTHYESKETLTVYMTPEGRPIKMLYKSGNEESSGADAEKTKPIGEIIHTEKFDDTKFKELAYLMFGAFVIDGSDYNYDSYQTVVVLEEYDGIKSQDQIIIDTNKDGSEPVTEVYFNGDSSEDSSDAIIKVRIGMVKTVEITDVRTTSENEKKELIGFLSQDKLTDGNANDDFENKVSPWYSDIKAECLNERIITVAESTGTSTEQSENEYFIYTYQEDDRYMVGIVPVE